MFSDSEVREARRIFQEEMRKNPVLRVDAETLKKLEIVAYHRGIRPEPQTVKETSIRDLLPEPDAKRAEIGKELSKVAKKHNIGQNVRKVIYSGLSKKQIRELLAQI